HTLRGGAEGIDVLAFGERHYPLGSTFLPRAGVSWGLGAWARTGDPEDHPWKREAEAGAPDVPPSSSRPSRIGTVDDLAPSVVWDGTPVRSGGRDPGRAAGPERTGLRHVTVAPGALMHRRTATLPRRRSSSCWKATVRSSSGPARASAGSTRRFRSQP